MLISQMPNFILKTIRPFRQKPDKNGGGKMIFIRDGSIAKRFYAYEESISKVICLTVTVSKAAFTLIYKLIIYILLVNKVMYKWPYLYIKT